MVHQKQIYLLLLLVSTISIPIFSGSFYHTSVDFPYYFQDRNYEREAGKASDHQGVERTGKQDLLSIPTGTFTAGNTGNEKIADLNRPNPGYGKTVYGINTHSGKLFAVAYSPDGKIIATGGEDRVVKLWETETRNEIRKLEKHTGAIKDLTFSPDGKMLVSCGVDTNIVIWNIKNGDVIKILPGFLGNVLSVDFSPNGKLLASGGDFGTIKIWRTDNWAEIETPFSHHASVAINSVHFSPNGKLLASCGDDHYFRLWDMTRWKLDSETYLSQRPTAIRFSPDGKHFATGCWTGTFAGAADTRLYDLESRDPETLEGHVNGIGLDAIDFSPDGKLLATGGWDETVRLWDVTSKEQIKVFAGHTRVVDAVAFSPDGSMIAACGYDGIIWLWNVARGAEEGNFIGHQSTVYIAVFSPDGQTLASGSYDNNIILWNVTTYEKMFELAGHDAAVHSVAFSPDGKLLVSGSRDTTVRLWNVTEGIELPPPASPLTHHANTMAVWPVIFSLDGTVVMSGSYRPENAIRLWNVTDEKELLPSLEGYSYDVSSLALSPDGSLLASGSWDSTIIIWNITSRQPIRTLNDHEAYIRSVVFLPNGEHLASGGSDSIVRIWDVTNGNFTKLEGQGGAISSVAISPGGDLVAAGNIEGVIQLWNLTNGEKSPIKTIYIPAASVFSIDFSPDGNTLVSSDNNGNIKLWNVNANPDGDLDGMPDNWESEYNLDPVDFWDKFNDQDNDGLMNSLEYFRRSNPLERDSDGDGMPDGWEHLSGTDPAVPDNDTDSDGDYITALYEYQMGLDPWHDDGVGDKDGDSLTNLQEFHYGSWANQSDSDLDGMPDDFEYKHGLNPQINDSWLDEDNDLMNNLYEYYHGLDATNFNDALLDKDEDRMVNQYEAIHELNASDPNDASGDADNDGMTNLWEYQNDFNATNPNDAWIDSDGDWVMNVDEFRAGTNPKNFWSVPLLSFSIFHALVGLLLLLISIVAVFSMLKRRREKQMLLTARLKAPDYQTALKIVQSNYIDYFEYIRAISGAQKLVEDGTAAYYQGDPTRTKNLYGQALAVFDRVDSKSLVAETIFRMASVMKETRELEMDSEILKRFPPSPWKEPVVEAIDQMIKALLAENEMNWGLANQAWQAALDIGVLSKEFQIKCQGSLAGFAVRNWLDNPDTTPPKFLISQLDEWLEDCEINLQHASLCQGYFLRSQIAFASVQFDKVEEWLNKCLRTAEENNLVIYRDQALKELDTLAIHKQQVSAILESEKPLSPEEQERMLHAYIREALESLKREGLE
ncbi:MAG: hypothetical protein ACFFCU_10830 [Promethearchaeota archaeon]